MQRNELEFVARLLEFRSKPRSVSLTFIKQGKLLNTCVCAHLAQLGVFNQTV